jgi:hypothetical protein
MEVGKMHMKSEMAKNKRFSEKHILKWSKKGSQVRAFEALVDEFEPSL